MADSRRRNGLPPSCEPCRKSKVRCDHSKPVCSRCMRRGKSAQCYYHPAPMSASAFHDPAPRRSISQTSEHPGLTDTSSSPTISTHQSLIDASATLASPPLDTPQAYDLINVNKDLMCFADPETLHPKRVHASLNRMGVAAPEPSSPSERMVRQGVRLLNTILDVVSEIGVYVFDSTADQLDICGSGHLGKIAWGTASTALKKLLNDRSPANLESVCRSMIKTTSQPPVFPTTPGDGALQTAFSELRLEFLGIFCAELGVYIADERDLKDNYSAHKDWKTDRKALMLTCFQCSVQCESLSYDLGAVNDFTLWFAMILILYATWTFGDDSLQVQRLMGNMTTAFLALGYHKGVPITPSVPRYLIEIRRKAVAWAHDHDKVSAIFTQRPPRLSVRFCATDLPLELPEDVVVGHVQGFEEAAANLDENGWCKEGKLHAATHQRFSLLLSPIREEALELINGPGTPDLEMRARRALVNLASVWEALPVRARDEDHPSASKERQCLLWRQYIRLEHIYTEFLLRALLRDVDEKDHRLLISCAHEVLGLVLLPHRQRDLGDGRRSDMEWTLVFFAMPCASVLVLELLRQAQNPQQNLVPNRSGIIQDISVLIACCDSLTKTGRNNYQICERAKSIFARSLDSILNPPAPALQSKTDVGQKAAFDYGQPTPMNYEQPSGQDPIPEWTAWLESVGLQAEPWLDSMNQWMDFPMEGVA